MRISFNEALYANKKGLKIQNNEPLTNPINEPTETKTEDGSALQSNNLAFQGLASSKLTKSPVLKNAAYKAMIALTLLSGAMMNQSCTIEMSQYADFDMTSITALFEELLALQQAQLAANNASLEEQKAQTAWLEKIYNESVAQGKTLDEFKAAVVAYMLQDSALQNQIYEQLKKNGASEEEAAATLKEIKELYAQEKYSEAYDKIIDILSSIDSNVKDIKTAVLDISAKLDKYHAEYMEAQNKTAELLVNIYEQDKEHYSINSEKLDSLIAINARQEAYLANIESNTNQLLAIGQDSTKFNQLITAIAESKTEIDYEKFEKMSKMIGINIQELKDAYQKDNEKTRKAFVDAVNDFKYTYLKTEKEQTAEMKEINSKLSILEKFPALIEDAIANGLDIDLSVLEMAIKENTTAVKENAMISVENSEMIAGKIDEFSGKLDKIVDQLSALIKDFGKHAGNVSDYNEVYQAKWDKTLELLGATAEKLAAGNADIIKELQELQGSQNTSNRYLNALLEQNEDVVVYLDSIAGLTGGNGMTIDEYKEYMDEALPAIYNKFVQYSIDTGLDKLPSDVTELKEAVVYLRNKYPEDVKALSGQMDTIITLLGNLEDLTPKQLTEIAELIKNFKCNCDCGGNYKGNEGILGDLQDKLG